MFYRTETELLRTKNSVQGCHRDFQGHKSFCHLNLRNSLTLSLRNLHIGDFPDFFSFRHFWASSSYFQILRVTSLNSALNSRLKKPSFCRLNVLVCCCAANQYSKITFIFSKILKYSAESKG